jgi:hypothetical protein
VQLLEFRVYDVDHAVITAEDFIGLTTVRSASNCSSHSSGRASLIDLPLTGLVSLVCSLNELINSQNERLGYHITNANE